MSKLEKVLADFVSARTRRDKNWEKLHTLIEHLDPDHINGPIDGAQELCQEIEGATDELNFAVQQLKHLVENGPHGNLMNYWKSFTPLSDNARLGHGVWTEAFDCGFIVENWELYSERHNQLRSHLNKIEFLVRGLLREHALKLQQQQESQRRELRKREIQHHLERLQQLRERELEHWEQLERPQKQAQET
ncbi:hypothetical protein PC116_g33056 [Phytophthora cactorum]|nr:hypothetical protein PC116_g33056 [Phytophthora cactorum]